MADYLVHDHYMRGGEGASIDLDLLNISGVSNNQVLKVINGVLQGAADETAAAGQGIDRTTALGLIATWAQAGNTDAIPAGKLTNAPTSTTADTTLRIQFQRSNSATFPAAPNNDNQVRLPWTAATDYNEPNESNKFTYMAIRVGTGAWQVVPVDRNVVATLIEDDAIITRTIQDGAVTTDKIANDAVTSAKIDDGAVGIDQLSTTNAASGNKVLKTDSAGTSLSWEDDESGSGGGGGLTSSQVDARVKAGVQDWAEADNSDVIPDAKSGASSAVNSAVATNAPLAIGDNPGTDGQYHEGGAEVSDTAAIAGSQNRWATESHRHPWREHEAEVFNVFQGDAWETANVNRVAFAIERRGSPPEDVLLERAVGSELGADVLPVQAWSAGPLVTGPFGTNRVFYMRVALALSARSSARINLDGTGEAGSVPQTISADTPPSTTFTEKTRNASFVYYECLAVNKPSSATFVAQEFDPLEMDLDKLDVSNLATRLHINERPGATVLQDGPGAGMALTAWNATNVRSAGGFSAFTPAFDLDDTNNQYGEFLSEITLRMSGRSSTSIGFNTEHDTVHRITDFAFASALRGTTAYSSGSVEGLAIGSVDLYDASTKAGTITVYLAKNALNQVGYYYRYAVETSPAYQGTASSSISSNISVAFEHGDVPEVPSGGGGTASLAEYTPAADVTAPWGSNLNEYGAWTDVVSHTITSAQAGLLGLDAQSRVSYPEPAATTIGGSRFWVQERILHTRGVTETIIAQTSTYLRNVNIGTAIDKERYLNIAAWHQCQTGDVIKVQGMVARQHASATGTGIVWDAANTKLQVVKIG